MTARVFYPFRRPDPLDRSRAAFEALDAHLAATAQAQADLDHIASRETMHGAVTDALVTLEFAKLRLSLIGSACGEGSAQFDLAADGIRAIEFAVRRIALADRQAREIEDRLEGPKTGGAA